MLRVKRTLILLVLVVLILSACVPTTSSAPIQPISTQSTTLARPTPTPNTSVPTQSAPLTSGSQVTVTLRALFYSEGGYQEGDITTMTAKFQQQHPNIKVEADFVHYSVLHDTIVTAAGSHAGAYDVAEIDCVWPAEFAARGFIRDVTDRVSPDLRKDIWPGAMDAVTYKGRLYAMPWLNDVMYLYYNSEMLKAAGFDTPPKTWEELNQMAMAAKQKGLVKYPFIEFFNPNEGLTGAFTYYLLSFGGKFFDTDGNPTFNSPEGQAALDFMVNGMKSGLYNPASLSAGFYGAPQIFLQGSALFSTNWTYLLNQANDPKQSQIAGKVKIALMPGQTVPSVTVNGGSGLAVMANSQHPDEAWQYITYLASKDVQKHYAASALPIWISLFDDPDLVKQQPELITVSREQYKYLQNRPIVPFYTETSDIISREVYNALTGAKTAQEALAAAEKEIKAVKERYK